MNDDLTYPAVRKVFAGPSAAGPAIPTVNEGEWMAAQLDALAAPPRNCGGVDAGGNLPSEDEQLLAKTSHVRRKGERLLQLIARVGIAPSQIRAWSKTQIEEFCERAEQHFVNDFVRRPTSSVPTQGISARPAAGCTAILVG